MKTVEFDTITKRIIEVLGNIEGVREVIYGRPDNEIDGNSLVPFIWVSPSESPLISQRNISRGSPPAEEIQVEYWIVTTVNEYKTEQSQQLALKIAVEVERKMKLNHLLKKDGTNDLNIISSKFKMIPRLPQPYGQPVVAQNVIMYITLVVNPPQNV